MAITLKNITASDTISSMVDKINFNFDQILLNGGGIEGPRGVEGYPGMQGNPGEKGSIGPQGQTGERGVHFHLLENQYISHALVYGLGERDPFNDEYKAGDMIIVYTQDSINPDVKYIDRICEVEDTIISGQPNFRPKETGIIFSQNVLLEEIAGSTTNKTLIRTKYNNSDEERGLILNDYHHNIVSQGGTEPFTISDEQIKSIVQNNIVLVYTENNNYINENQQEETNVGSPNCGIVFYRNGEYNSNLGNFPRINYVVSSDLTDGINYFNITAPTQELRLTAKNDIILNSTEKNIKIKTTKSTSEISIERNNSKVLISKNGGADASVKELHLIGDTLFFEKENSENDRWLEIKNKNLEHHQISGRTCNIVFSAQNTVIQSDGFFSIGKGDLEAKYGSSSDDDYFNQSRISVINGGNNPHIDIVSPEVFIGRDPSWENHCNNFGLVVSSHRVLLSSNSEPKDASDPYSCNTACIEANSEDINKANVKITTGYPGVTKIANVSEKYLASILNYTDGTVNDAYVFGTSPMIDNIIKNGRYNYAHMNCYQNMSIRNINNMGAVHGGTITFKGKYSNNSNSTYDELIYNFIRIGNTVHCKFHGTVNTMKLCARTSVAIEKGNLEDYGESYYKSTSTVKTSWPTSNSLPAWSTNYHSPFINDQSSKFPSNDFSFTPNYSGSDYKKGVNDFSYKVSVVTLNKLYLDLYPPIIKLSQYVSGNNTIITTNVSDLYGHLTYSMNGSTYEKELYYYDNITRYNTSSQSSQLYKIPAITIRNMYNSTTSGEYPVYDSANTFTIDGSSSESIVEIDGYFSYLLASDSEGMHQHKHGIQIGNLPIIIA